MNSETCNCGKALRRHVPGGGFGCKRKERRVSGGRRLSCELVLRAPFELAQPDAYCEQYGKWRYEDLPILPESWKYAVPKDKKKAA